MKRILEDIQTGQLKHVYLLYGDERYLVNQYTQKLRDALSEPGDDVNTTRFSGQDIDPGQVIDLAETLPFFADHRSIFLDGTGFFKKGGDALADYVKDIPKSAYLVFTETEVDRRSRLFRQVQQEGRVVEFPRQDEDTLMRWILGRIRRENKQIARPVLEFFLSRTGNDMERISRELEKLLCYTMDKDIITREDVEAVCTTQLSDEIFGMVDAVAGKQQKRALEMYYDLLMLREAPMRILSLLTRQFQILLQLKEMAGEGVSDASMAAQVKVPVFAIRKYLGQARKFTAAQLRETVRDGVQAEEDIKTGRMNDRLAVELFLMEHSK